LKVFDHATSHGRHWERDVNKEQEDVQKQNDIKSCEEWNAKATNSFPYFIAAFFYSDEPEQYFEDIMKRKTTEDISKGPEKELKG